GGGSGRPRPARPAWRRRAAARSRVVPAGRRPTPPGDERRRPAALPRSLRYPSGRPPVPGRLPVGTDGGMKRVLILIKGLGRGGAEQLLASAAPYADRSRFQYEVAYVLPWKTALVGELGGRGLRVSCLGGGRRDAWALRLRSLVRERRVDLV